MSPARVGLGVALVFVAVIGVIARRPMMDALSGPGAASTQRPLAGGTAGVNPRLAAPLRVIVLDGLSRADAPRLPALAALCARGAQLTVDVGFPTKSLIVQRALWSGLTTQQTGDGYDNELVAAPPSSLPLLVPGAIAVVESHAVIARSVGFGVVQPPPEADGVDPLAVPAQVQAWKAGEFAASARAAVASPAPLVLVHVLAIDEAAHRGGRSGADYRDALAAADAVVATALTAAPDAQWLVLADHGHVSGGGHGDVEDEVRRVAACFAPAPAGITTGEVHLVDVARWLADSAGAPRDPRAVGRTLAVAVTHPDRDATLPRPSWPARVLALIVVALGVAAAVRMSGWRRETVVVAAWPALSALAVLAIHGLPTLSHRPPTWLLATSTLPPCVVALACARRTCGASARVAIAVLGTMAAVAVAAAILGGVPAAIAAGPPPRVPYWTAVLGAAAGSAVIAAGVTGAFLVGDEVLTAVRGVRSTGHPRPKHGH